MEKLSLKTAVVLVSMVSFLSTAQPRIDLELKSAVLKGPFVLTNDYIIQTVQSEPTNGGVASFSFTLTNPGDYVVSARIEVPTDQKNSLFLNIDGETNRPEALWEIPPASGFSERIVTSHESTAPALSPGNRRIFKLAPGAHQLTIRGWNANTKVAGLSLLRLPATPTGLTASPGASPQPPAPPTNLRIVSEDR